MAILSRLLLCGVLVFSACGKQIEDPPLTSGIDASYMDPSVRPQDDFSRYANGSWMDTTEMPADKSRIGSFTELSDQSKEDVRAIIEELLESENLSPGSEEQTVADFFRSYMDMETRNQLRIKPIASDLEEIQKIQTKAALFEFFGSSVSRGMTSPVETSVYIDGKDSSQYVVYLSQGGLGLPDRDYYLDDSEKFESIRKSYLNYVQTLFKLAQLPDPETAALVTIALETQLAAHHWTKVENRDRDKTYNKFTPSGLQQLTDSLDWSGYLQSSKLGTIEELVVRQPDYLEALATVIEETPLSTWKTYLTFHVLNNNASVLDQAFDDAQFAFQGKILSGQEEQEALWKRAVQLIDRQIGEIVGKIYVRKHFNESAKTRMVQLVENLRTAYGQSIDEIDWMGAETKKEAQKKLAAFTPKIGYPDIWKDYQGLTIASDDLVGNLQRTAQHRHQDDVKKLKESVRKWEWGMTPQTVNAYYSPPRNEIVFPAGILQPPFFNMNADDAANYGAIGAVIGHEMGHGFDDQGSKSDADGNLRNWWTDTDREEFKKRTGRLVEQYSAFKPFEDVKVNGELTLGENIGDLAGLTIAYKAYQISLNGKDAPVIDGLTGAQRFFLSWAQCWRVKTREEALRKRIVTDPHSPPQFRIIGPLMNLPQFHAAFDVKQGDPMYLPPKSQVKIW